MQERATSSPANAWDGEAASRTGAGRADALCWIVLGAAILLASLMMDRLERQGVQPYTAPGLLPGLLGIAMMALGLILFIRSRRERISYKPPADEEPAARVTESRVWIVLALCLTFGIGLIGHGLPFWLASALFVTVSILVLQWTERAPAKRWPGARGVMQAAATGLGAGLIITLVFQEIFLVRLP